MKVKKRDGTLVPVRLDEITDRIAKLSSDLDQTIVDPVKITLEVVEKIHDSISTSVLDTFTAEICHSKSMIHPDFNILASRLIISDHHKNVLIMAKMKFSKVCELLYTNTDQLGELSPLISDELYAMSQEYSDLIDEIIDHERDFNLDYFGFKTLRRGYLLRVGDKVVETPQHMFMRVALGMHGNLLAQSGKEYKVDFDLVKETYDLLSNKYFTHATPTLYNSGTRRPQFFSCFLLNMDDTLDSIYKTLADTAQISKWSGGIGIHISSIRSNGSYIRGTSGRADGVVPMLKVYNDTARYVNQGGKRMGSFAMYIEPWHADIRDFLKCKLPHGDDNRRARDLFYALWIPDLFMERVKEDGDWSLMCPSECPGLSDAYGDDFKILYEQYESEGKMTKSMKAQDLFREIVSSQIETGTPYMCYKDAANQKSNQKNLGTIRSSNLCVAPETRILTDKGWFPIQGLENHKIKVWNGEQWSDTEVKKTGINQKLIRVTLSNGSKIDCTEYHKFPIKNGIVNSVINWLLVKKDNFNMIAAKDLRQGMRLIDHDVPTKKDMDKIPNSILNSMMGAGVSKNELPPVHIVSVEDINRTDDTYCFTEPIRHMGMFEGILTGQCSEIIEYSDSSKYACCVLASIVLPTYVTEKEGKMQVDHQKLYEVVQVVARNLNKLIDINYYPVEETKTSNFSERPIGIGVQGLADVFYKLKLPYDSEGALQVDKEIFETIYFASMNASMELAKKDGPYPSYEGSPISQGKFQFDLWKEFSNTEIVHSGRWDWELLRSQILEHGVRNSLVTALMPTASTSQIMGSTAEAFEPVTSNAYTRRTLAGEFIILNKYMASDLIERGLWGDMRNKLLESRGSLQAIKKLKGKEVPQDLHDLYKTVWELKQKSLIDHSAARGIYIDQSQSLNLYFAEANHDQITKAHFYGHKKGLKTGSYYIRSKPAVNSISFTKDDSDSEDSDHENSESSSDPKKYDSYDPESEYNDDCEACGA
jgi:ribonucleotide reductase alpha subunit